MRRYVVIAVVGLTLRLILAAFFPGNWDQDSYLIVARIVERGGNVYAETARYNYSPLWAYLLAGLDVAERAVGLRFDFLTRAFLAVVDLADAVLIAGIAKRSNLNPRLAFLTFLLSPVSILLTGLHGQFENLAALPLLLGAYLALGKAPKGWLWSLAALALTAKHILIFSVWDFLGWLGKGFGQGVLLMIGAGMVFLVSFGTSWLVAPRAIVGHVLLYSSNHGLYGLGLLPPTYALPLFLGLMVCLVLATSRQPWPVYRRLAFMAVALLAFLPGMGEQYLAIVPLFASVRPSRWLAVWSLVASAAILNAQPSTFGGPAPSPLLWNGLFLVTVGWLVSLLGERSVVEKSLSHQTEQSHRDGERELSLSVGR